MLAGLAFCAGDDRSGSSLFYPGQPDGSVTRSGGGPRSPSGLSTRQLDRPAPVDLENAATARHPRTPPGRSPGRGAGAVGGSIEDLHDRDDDAPYELDGRASPLPAEAARVSISFIFFARRLAPRTTFTATPTSIKPSSACWPTSRRGPTCSTQPGLLSAEQIRLSATRSRSRSTSSPSLASVRRSARSLRRAQRVSVGGGLTRPATNGAIEAAGADDGDLSGWAPAGRVAGEPVLTVRTSVGLFHLPARELEKVSGSGSVP